MNKNRELIKAILLLPSSALVLIPALIVQLTRSLHFLWGLEFPATWMPFLGALVFILTGGFFAVWTVSLFLSVGDGTPAPWAPPKRLVVAGPYCYVRNPMLLSVISILVGESILLGSVPVLIWAVAFWGINTAYFAYFEEPSLVKRFGDDYLEYKNNVRRWIPRLTPFIKYKS